MAALRAAGYEPTRAAQQPGYFVCRIDGKPADDPCQRASPEDAYWSYWHAEPGGSWAFSNAGAAEYDPVPGAVEGWAFGAGEPPSTPPPARREPRQQPSDTVAPSRAPVASARPVPSAVAATTAATPRTAPPSQARIPTASVQPTGRPTVPPDTTPEPAPSVAASATSAALTVGDPASPGDGDSPLVGVLLAGAVVAGLGAAAAFQAQKRR